MKTMKNAGNFKKGSVELVVLKILQLYGDCYGYQISQLITSLSDDILQIPEGSLYPTLYKLQEQGLVSDYRKKIGKRLIRVYYHLEAAGLQRLHELTEEYYQINRGIQMIISAEPSD